MAEKGLLLTPAFESHQLVSIGRMVSEGLGLSVITRRQQELSVAAQAMEVLIKAS